MEVYILDSLLRRIDVIDTFISMIWTERFSDPGDFELVTLATTTNKKRFVQNIRISITESKGVMTVETVEEYADAEGRHVLKVKGRDLLALLEARTALEMLGMPISGIAPSWIIPGIDPAGAMRYIFQQICVAGSISPRDNIPFLEWGSSLYPPSTIPEPTVQIDWEGKPQSLLAALQELGDIYDLGFRLYKDPDLTKLYFNVYAGSDRTTSQDELPPVVFSPDMANLVDTTEFSDSSKAYNTVQVVYIYKNEFDVDRTITVLVEDDEISSENVGLDRKVKLLVVTNISDEITDKELFLLQLGQEELRKSRPLSAFDGEVVQNSTYVYEKDYYLGDIVEVRGKTGASAYMRAVEQIFVQDVSGQRSYPTLITKIFINPGTWAAWKYDVEWTAIGSEEYWVNQ